MNIETVFNTLSWIAWIIAILVAVVIFTQKMRSQTIRKGNLIIVLVVAGALVLSLVSAGLVFINPEERGVVISAIADEGYRKEALQPGLAWIVPFAENVIPYPISKQTYTMSILPQEGQLMGDDSIEARTMDGQKVLIDASVIYSIDPASVVQVHVDWQKRFDIDLIRPVTRGVIRDAVSQFGIEEVYSTKRAELVKIITDALGTSFTNNGIILHEFVLRNISFSDEYAASVEQKQIAEQLAQQASFVVSQREFEADQARAVAEGERDAMILNAEGLAESRRIEAIAEAEALQLINDVIIQNPDLINYMYIQKIAANTQVIFLPAEAPYLFDLGAYQTGEESAPTILPTPTVTPTEEPTN